MIGSICYGKLLFCKFLIGNNYLSGVKYRIKKANQSGSLFLCVDVRNNWF